MKTKFLFLPLLLLGFVSCSDSDKIVEEAITPTTDTEASARYISIFSDAACQHPVIQNYPLNGNKETISFALQRGQNEVYVKYNTPSGAVVEKMEVTEAALSSRADPGTQHYLDLYEATSIYALEYSGGESTPGYMLKAEDGFTSYHCSGVVMFEDSWPSKSNVDGESKPGGLFFGDYNDFVVDYDLESIIHDAGAEEQRWKEKLKVVLHIRARGGGYSQRFGLKLEGLDKDFIDSDNIEISYSMSNQSEPVEPLLAEVLWDGKNPVIYVNEVNKLVNESFMNKNGLAVSHEGSNSYYNTINDGKNVTKGLFTITVTFNGNGDRDKINELFRTTVMTSTKHNFFLVTNNKGETYEIHLAGYEPTGFYTTYGADMSKMASGVAVAKNTAVKYLAADKNVWAFKTPVLVKHVTERTNFGVSYPDYEKWVTSGDAAYQRWYENIGKAEDGESLIIPW